MCSWHPSTWECGSFQTENCDNPNTNQKVDTDEEDDTLNWTLYSMDKGVCASGDDCGQLSWRWEIILRSLRMITSLVITACRGGGIVKLLFQYSLLTVTDFIFDKHVSRGDTLDTTKIFQKDGVARDAWPLHFGGLNDNCSNMVIDTDFKFEVKEFRWQVQPFWQ